MIPLPKAPTLMPPMDEPGLAVRVAPSRPSFPAATKTATPLATAALTASSTAVMLYPLGLPRLMLMMWAPSMIALVIADSCNNLLAKKRGKSGRRVKVSERLGAERSSAQVFLTKDVSPPPWIKQVYIS